MARILVVEDEIGRVRVFERLLRAHEVAFAANADVGIRVLLDNGPWDAVFLDRDLGASPLTGEDVAKAFHLLHGRRPQLVIIHSWNLPAAERMLFTLEGAAIRTVVQIPFGAPTFAETVRALLAAL